MIFHENRQPYRLPRENNCLRVCNQVMLKLVCSATDWLEDRNLENFGKNQVKDTYALYSPNR